MKPEHPSDPPRQTFPHQGLRLAYTVEGEGPWMLALSGLPGSVRDFRWLAPLLSPHLRLLRLELPGYGQSQRQGWRGHGAPERAQVALALLDHLGVEAAHVVTHSAGAFTAAHLAQVAPQRLLSCSLLAMPGPWPHYPQALYQWMMLGASHGAGRALLAPLLRWLYGWAGFPSSLSDAERLYTTLDAAAHDFARYGCEVSELPSPTLVAWAQDDRLIPEDRCQAIERLAPEGPRLHFAQGGHNIQKTQAVEIAQAILQMLDLKP